MEQKQSDPASDDAMDSFLEKFRSQPYRGGFREDKWEEVGSRGGCTSCLSRPVQSQHLEGELALLVQSGGQRSPQRSVTYLPLLTPPHTWMAWFPALLALVPGLWLLPSVYIAFYLHHHLSTGASPLPTFSDNHQRLLLHFHFTDQES